MKIEIEDKIVQEVVNSFIERSNVGIKKYGTTLNRNDLSTLEWIKHLQEELQDATLYIQKIITELEKSKV